MTPSRRSAAVAAVLAAATTLLVASPAMAAAAPAAERVFPPSATELSGDLVRLPLHRGTSGDRTVWFVVADASDGEAADRYGVPKVAKLANARGTAAVQRGTAAADGIRFAAKVDFGPRRAVVAGPGGFPPALAQPGAVGEPGYTPLVELSDGTVLNAPQVANDTGVADKVVAIDTDERWVVVRETNGFARGDAVRYASFDASDPAVAALEASTYAPALGAAPAADDDSTASARASLAAIVNGATGAADPQRQGLSSALLDGLDPLNVLRWTPNQGRYSPLWDVHPAVWSAAPRRLRSWDDVVGRSDGALSLAVLDVIVNCPIISVAG
jgi:hypothetical protein